MSNAIIILSIILGSALGFIGVCFNTDIILFIASNFNFILIYIAISLYYLGEMCKESREKNNPLNMWTTKDWFRNIGLSLVWWVIYIVTYVPPFIKYLTEERGE